MMSRQRSAAKCGDGVVVGRLLVSPTRRTGRAAAFFLYIFISFSRTVHTFRHSHGDDGGGRVLAKINWKTAARPLPAVIISRERQHAHTHDDGGGGSNRMASDISGSSGSSGNNILVP